MTMAPDTFAFVADLVARRSAIRLEAGKEYLVESRLGPMARERSLGIDEYVRRLRAGVGDDELGAVVEAMTTNETSWFRDVAPFAALRSHVLPLLREAGAGDRLRIWSAACSTGQEPYSILMALGDGAPSVDIVATDLNEQVLARAREGVYSQLEVNRGLPAAMLVRHFERVGAHWRVRADLRSRVQFRRHNLMDPPPPGPFDLVFLRNVLIYFDLPTKRAVLDRVARVLRPGGMLVLGAAETTLGVHDRFERIEAGAAVLHRPVPAPAAGALTAPIGIVPTPVGGLPVPSSYRPAPLPSTTAVLGQTPALRPEHHPRGLS
jgi:chemotaxis protein methyltransferase CheR